MAGEKNLATAVSERVVSVGIVADHLMHYTGGIFDILWCSGRIDHAVNVVGYGDGYWILRNSWGTTWGEEGYFRMVRGKKKCGLGSVTSYIEL